MTNKERYQRTFRTLHASDRVLEVNEMKQTKHLKAGRFLPVAVMLALILGLSTIGYAANLGGIRQKIKIWFHGDQTEAVMEIKDGSYTLTYEDEHGRPQERGGGGVAIYSDGTERPLTVEEMMEDLDHPEVEESDGRIWVYYRDQSIDITDQFQNGICRIKLMDEGKPIYMTIKEEGEGYAFATSVEDYPDPKTLN